MSAHPDQPGTSRATALRPNLPFRAAVSVIWSVFAVLLLVGGDPGDGLVTWAAAASLLPFLIASYVLLRVWTTRVWIDPDAGRLVHARLWRSRSAALGPPNTIRARAPAPYGPRPEWSMRVLTPEGGGVKVSAPWVTDLALLLSLMRPIVEEHVDMLDDDDARRLLTSGPRGD